MAIQIPDAGTGNGATGDNEFVLWTKVINNFSDQTNAASRLVGAEAGQIPLAQDVFKAAFGQLGSQPANGSVNMDDLEVGTTAWIMGTASANNLPPSTTSVVVETKSNSITYATALRHQIARDITGNSVWERNRRLIAGTTKYDAWFRYLTSANTTKDGNGFLKGASPIVKVFADKVELNDDAVNQNVTYKKNGIGDYAITTVSGLSTDGWYIELPKDMNGNPKVAVTLSEVDGVISLKTYKRIFSMETFTFEPDLNNPLDIPDTRWIDLRLNEIPFEAQEELPTDGG